MSDAVLVIGGGITGIRTALDLAKAGARVVLVEKSPTVGGKMSAVLDENSPDHDVFSGVEPPKMIALEQHDKIEVLALSQVIAIEGEQGRFKVKIRQRARFVTDLCEQCNCCRQVCPVVKPNEFDAGLTFRKAIYNPLPRSVPKPYVIDIDSCLNDPPNYLACQRCIDVCEYSCIDFSVPREQIHTRKVASVIVATGFDLEDPQNLADYGYGTHPDILTSMELDRLLSQTGPTSGYLERPSNEEEPNNVLIIMRDASRFSWSYVAYHTARLVAQDITDISVLYPDQAAFGNGFCEFWRATAGAGVKLIWGNYASLEPSDSGNVTATYKQGDTGKSITQNYDIVTLTMAARPATDLQEVARTLDITLTHEGYVKFLEHGPDHTHTTQQGIYVAGCATGPKSMIECLPEATAAASSAMSDLDHFRHRSDAEHLDPPTPSPDAQPAAIPPTAPQLTGDQLRAKLEQTLDAAIALAENNGN